MTEPSSNGATGRSRIPVRLLVFGLVAVLAFWLGFLVFDANHARVLVRRYGYYTIALTFAWAVFALIQLRPVVLTWWSKVTLRERWQAAAAIAGCVTVAVLTTPIGYKVLYDEMVLQVTASNMHALREMSTAMRAYTIDGVFLPLDSYVDKRPFFFAFLVSLVHDLTGYREANAFALNIGLMLVALGQVYLIVRRFAAHGAALAAVVSLGTLSTLAHSGTGAGMEMLNLVMALLVAQLAMSYLDAPDEGRLSGLLLATVLLAQTRYESSLYILPVALVTMEGWRRAGRIVMPLAAILAPALLIPYAVHNTYLSGTPMLWELKDNAQSRFELANLGPNLRHAVAFLFNTTPQLTNSLWLSAAGLLSAGYAAVVAWKARRSWRTAEPAFLVLPLMSVAVVGNIVLLMAYYWGQLDDPTVSRLSLPFAAMLALAVGFAVHRLGRARLALAPVAAGGAVVAFLWTGAIANAQLTKMNSVELEIAWERACAEALPPGDRLIITNKSALPWMISRVPAIGLDYARRRVEALRYQLATGGFREILVSQRYRAAGPDVMQLDPGDRLPEWFVLQPVVEKRFGAHIDRISRLVEIKPEPVDAAKAPPAAKTLPDATH